MVPTGEEVDHQQLDFNPGIPTETGAASSNAAQGRILIRPVDRVTGADLVIHRSITADYPIHPRADLEP